MCPACSYLREDFSEISSTFGHGQAWTTPPAHLHYLPQRTFFGGTLRKQISTFHAWQLVPFAKSPSTAALFLAWTNRWSPLGMPKEHITGKHVWCYSSSRQAWFSSWTSGGTSQRDNKIVTTPCFGQRFDSTSCWIKHESIQMQFQHHTVN